MEREVLMAMQTAIKENNMNHVKELLATHEGLQEYITVFGSWVEYTTIFGSYEMLKYFILVKKNGSCGVSQIR